MSWTTLVAGTTITSAWANTNVRDQTVSTFASSTARDAAITAPTDGLWAYTTDTNRLWNYDGAKWVLIGGSMPRVKVTRSTAQSVANSSNTVITWDTETYDTDAIHDLVTNTGRFTVPAGLAGTWRVDCNLDFAANATGVRAAWFEVNSTGAGTRYSQASQNTNVAGGGTDLLITDTLLLAVGDFVNVCVVQTSGGALNSVNSATNQAFRAHYIGPT